MVDEKFIGLSLAILASCAIGSSYVITKTGLIHAAKQHGFQGDGFEYFRSPIWWCGTITFASGELMNTTAYAFAPAVLVTPLGALSVLIGAVSGAYFLKEELRTLGKLGCATCLLGSIMLVLHAPPDEDIQTIDEILHLAIQPFFLLYCLFVTTLSVYLIYVVGPKQGKTNPLIYISICSTIGSVSVMSVKAFGIAVKLTFAGENQFSHPSTYAFLIILIVTTLTQMNYLNKATNEFPVSLINAMYYVGFTTCTLSASFILYQGLNTSDIVATISLISGFLLNFLGIALLTISKTEGDDYTLRGQGRGTQRTIFSSEPIELQSARYTPVLNSRSMDINRESEDGHYRNRRISGPR